MPRVESVLRVLNAFRLLDGIVGLASLSKIPVNLAYPGKYHSFEDIYRVSGLPRTTVYDVLDYLVSKGVVERRESFHVMYRLLDWSFTDGSLRYVVELDRVLVVLV